MALAAYYDRMKHREGWAPERLVPLLAGLDQLVPWLLQWHNDVDPDLQPPLGEFYRDFVRDEARSLGYTVEQLRAWQPPHATREPSAQVTQSQEGASCEPQDTRHHRRSL